MNPGENLILSLAEIEVYNGQGSGKPSGGKLRYFCPIHGGDRQRSFALDLETGRFQCHACGSWGYTTEARERNRQEWIREQRSMRPRPAPARPKRPEPPPRLELSDILREFQKALPGSWGEEYLRRRGISLEVAQAYGVGYAAPGKWPNPKRGWKWGRVVFPHIDPAGQLVNLYGRAVENEKEKAPRGIAHDHLPGAKGYFNARALQEGQGPLFVCEGAFDALALIAAGQPRTVAIFGVDGWRWEWARDIREMVFCLDADEAGQAARVEMARQAAMRAKRVYYLAPEDLGGHKDLSEAWAADALQLAEPDIADLVSTWPADLREAWEERAAILEVESKLTRSDAERASYELFKGRVGA